MITKLSPWVELGGFFLALIAGSINAIGFLGFQHEAVSHLSGTATLLAISVDTPQGSSSLHLLAVLLSFLAGATLSGVIIGDESLKLGRRYGWALALEAILLVLAMVVLTRQSSVGHYFASAACGLQNAMATTYSGAVVRTTHVTGLFTDLGLTLGAWIRGKELNTRKMILFMTLIGGFICGGFAGAIGYRTLGYTSLLGPAAGCLMLGAVYSIYKIIKANRDDSIHNGV